MTTEKSAAEVFTATSGDLQERLASLLEQVGPDKYNDFIHSDAYNNPPAETPVADSAATPWSNVPPTAFDSNP